MNVAIHPDFPLFLTTFEVERSWKGIDQRHISIHNWRDSGANCGQTFEVGERYLVFGYLVNDEGIAVAPSDEEALDPWTNACWRNSLLSEAADDIAALGEPIFTVVTPTLWGQIKALFD